ncbi:histone binding protein, putative [Babesia ovata]|uniref:Histone binding protein, putative n=1 Tax=Babesia ovata TaxID=189622 RepID=A0A2H6KHQ6_9APIC|nr:histone binding protein, putative [Babesia ovata]GBE62511.1 histone binding protein, putative [Babesia ovata]
MENAADLPQPQEGASAPSPDSVPSTAPPAYDTMSADELYELGKRNFKELRDYAEAAECFSRCLELRSSGNPLDHQLRECYLWYADSLLTKEEENQAMFPSDVDAGALELPDSSLPAGNEGDLPTAESILKGATEEASDETLAFEAFQIAFACYSSFLSSCTLQGAELEKEVLDASYCLMRLGDMLFTNNQFKEAAEEYERAVELRRKYHLGERHLASLYVSLAQCQMFSGNLSVSLDTFNMVKELIGRLLVGEMDEAERKRMQDTLEDVDLQINDLRKLIASPPAQTARPGSQCEAASLVPQTTDTFDERKLDTASKSAVINISENTTGSKRRIDISGMYK